MFEMLGALRGAVQGLWAPLLLNAILSTFIGIFLAIKVNDGSNETRIAAFVSGCAVSFLLYPRPVFISTLQTAIGHSGLLIGETGSIALGISPIGFAAILFPVNVGIAYLLLTYGFNLHYAMRQHQHVGLNVPRRSWALRILTIGSIYAYPFLVVCGVLFAFNNLQNTPLGTSGPFTLGKYAHGLIASPEVTTIMRLKVLAMILCFVLVSVVLGPILFNRVISALIRRYLALHVSRPTNERGRSISERINGTKVVLLTLVLILVPLHGLIIGRLLGLLDFWYESGVCSLSLSVLNSLSFDSGTGWALVATLLLAISYIYSLTRYLRPRYDGVVSVITVLFGLVAFFPGAMYGSLFLVLIDVIAVPHVPFWLGSWGFIVGGSLWLFLMADRFFSEIHYGYANLQQTRGLLVTAKTVVRNERLRLALIAFLVGYWIWVDDAYRFALGVGRDSYAGSFTDRLSHWSPEQRGLALTVLAGGILMLWLTSKAGLGEGRHAKNEATDD